MSLDSWKVRCGRGSHIAILIAGSLAVDGILFQATVVRSSGQESSFTLEGKISEKSEGKLTVSTTDNIIFHVRYDDKTEIKRADGSAGTGADLKVGEQINVAGELADSGEIMAKKIEIEKPTTSKDQP